MTSSLLLDRSTNDLCLDASLSIAVCTEPYAIAQDVACACSVFYGELWYATDQGVRYANMLGRMPPLAYVKAQFVAAALGANPDVTGAVCFISSFTDRELDGQVQVTTASGATAIIQVGTAAGGARVVAITDTGLFGVTDTGQEMTVA